MTPLDILADTRRVRDPVGKSFDIKEYFFRIATNQVSLISREQVENFCRSTVTENISSNIQSVEAAQFSEISKGRFQARETAVNIRHEG